MTQGFDPIESTRGDDAGSELDLSSGWNPLTSDVDELQSRLTTALHERIRLVDWIRGLEAELATLRERYADGDLDELARRLDELQQRYEEQVEQSRVALARAEERAQHDVDESIDAVKRSATWRVGSAVLAPIRWVRGIR